MCKSTGDITGDHVKLHLFGFSIIGRAYDWLQCIPNSAIQTWKELEEMFLERYYSNAQLVERKSIISTFPKKS